MRPAGLLPTALAGVLAGVLTVGLAAPRAGAQAAAGERGPALSAEQLVARGNAAYYRLDYARARADFEAALALVESDGSSALARGVLQDLGITLRSMGEGDLGLVYLHRALEASERHRPGGPSASLLSNLGSSYEGLGAAPLAWKAYEEAHRVTLATGSTADQHDALTRLGALDVGSGQIAAGRARLEQAVRLARALGGRLELAWTLGYLGWARAKDGDRAGAIEAEREMAVLCRELGWPEPERLHRARLAALLLEERPDEALALLAEAERLGDAGSPFARWEIARLRGRYWERRGDGERARASCRRALDWLEAERDGLAGRDDRRNLLADNRDLYDECLGRLVRAPGREHGEEALAVYERARAAAWLAVGRRVSGREGSRLEERREALLRRRSSATQAAPGEIDGLELELDQLGAALGSRREELARPPSFEALRAALGPDTAVLAFQAARHEIYVLVFTREHAALRLLPVTSVDLRERIAAWVDLVIADRRAGWLAAASALHQDLFAPLALEPSIEKLVIVPDGPLAQLAFEALVEPPSAARGGRFLLERYEVTYAPSVAAWLELAGRAARHDASALVVAAPTLAAAGPVSSGAELSRRAYLREGFRGGDLRHARAEARAVAARLGGAVSWLEGAAAAEGEVVRRLRAGPRIAHIASHGFAGAWSARRSALALAPDAEHDGFLQERELAGERVPADLVVLAACRTAAGGTRVAEHSRSLAHAFLGAGARTVVASLWDLPDRSAEMLVGSFYEHLARGRTRGQALREAKLERLRGGEAPRSWAPLVLIGDGEPPLAEVWKKHRLPVWPWLAATAALLTATLAASRRRKS